MKKQFSVDWARTGRMSVVFSAVVMATYTLWTPFGIAAHGLMAILDSAFATHLTPQRPWVAWAVVGAILGLGPSLWTIRAIGKRRLVVLWVPLLVIALVGAVTSMRH